MMYSRILVPIDRQPPSQRGLDEAIALAQQLGSTPHLLNVVDARLLIAEVVGQVLRKNPKTSREAAVIAREP